MKIQTKIKMKIQTLLMMAIVALCAVACSDDDEKKLPAIDWTGTYSGYSVAESKHFKQLYTDDESLKLASQADGTVALQFASKKWGTFEVAKVTVTPKGETYEFAGTGRVTMGMGDKKAEYDFTFSGNSHASKQPYSFSFHLPAVMGGLTVTLLPGKAPVASIQ